MHLPTKQSDAITDIAIKSRSLTELFLHNLLPCGKPVEISVSNDIFEGTPSTRLFLISEGQIFYRVRGKLVAVLEEGDLIGLTRSLNLNEGLFSCIEDVKLLPYERDELIAHVNLDKKLQKNWVHYLVCNIAFFQHALTQEIRAEFQPQAGFVHFNEGETIIQQGDIADKVYTLLDGSADAICDGVKVGDVNANEIFGALAVFTRQPRIASVIATSDCTVLAVRKEEFIDLIDHQPQICLSLIEEMATKINQLNNQLLSKQ